jgi:hypothetical protein
MTMRLFPRLAIALGIALLPTMLVLAADFGVTWDEPSRQANGWRTWLRYQGRIDPRADDDPYGGLFDVAAVALQHVVPRDRYHVRHLLNAGFGWLGIVGCAVLGWRIGGPGMALLAGALLALSPRYVGHSMNNPKDLPFAAAATWTLVALTYLPRTFPYLPLRNVVAVGTTTGLSLAIRPGGLLFVLYTSLCVLASTVHRRDWRPWHLCASALGVAGVLAIAMIVPMPVWPILWEKPLTVFTAAEQVSRYQWQGYVLFRGRDVLSTALPWTYAPVWLLVTTPPVILGGAFLSIAVPAVVWLMTFSARRRRARSEECTPCARTDHRVVHTRFLVGLWFAVLFPIAYVILRRSTLYDGLRHLLFIVPPLAVVAAAGWTMTLTRAPGAVRTIAGLLLALGLLEPLVFQLRNHPNQVVYFQPLAGGPRAAFGRFELDYWGNCLFQAVQHAGRVARAAGRPVAISGAQWRILQLDGRRVPQVFVIRPGRRRHELEITLLRGARRWLLAFEARRDLLWQVTTHDGAPLCAVTPGPRFEDLRRRLEQTGALVTLLPGAGQRP